MKRKHVVATALNHFFCLLIILSVYFLRTDNAQADDPPVPFLGPIYYGDVSVLKVFDHRYPLWESVFGDDGNSQTMHYDGSIPDDETGPYGYDQHTGIDYGLHYQPVLAAYPGEVTYADWSDKDNHRTGYGLYVKLEHKEEYEKYQTLYGHLSSLTVQFGQNILVDPENREGILGISGNTGAVTGSCPDVENNPLCAAHLHFELRYQGKPINPYGWINGIMSDPWAVYSVTTTPHATPGGSPTPTPRTITGATSYDVWLDHPANSNANTQYPRGTPVAEPPAPVAARTIDDADPEFTTDPQSCMQSSTTGGLYGTFHYTEVNTIECVASWHITPNELTQPGWYDVYVYIPEITWSTQISLTRGAEYEIVSELQPPQTAIVVQAAYPNNSHPDRWAYIGRYEFAMEGANEYIRVSNLTFEGGGGDGEGFIVAADAIQLAPVNPGQPITPTPLPTGTPTPTPTSTPAMVQVSINQGSDDAGQNAVIQPDCSVMTTAAPEIYLGRCFNGVDIISGLRFASVPIPRNAVITQARIRFIVDGQAGNPDTDIIDVIFQGELSANSVTFSSSNPPSARSPLTSSIRWYVGSNIPWDEDQTHYSPELKAIVQAIVNLPDWDSGDPITFIARPRSGWVGSVYRRVFAWERIDHIPAKLEVWYTLPTPTPTPTATPPIVNTGFMSPNASVAGVGGDGNGYENQPYNAYNDGGSLAGDKKSGVGTIVGDPCVSSATDKHIFRDFNIAIPTNAAIRGIEVRLDALNSIPSALPQMCVQLSWDGGTTWTNAPQVTPVLTNSELTYILGSPTYLWGRSWLPTEFANSSFRLRVVDFANSTSTDFYLDWVAVKVTYQ